MRGAEPPESAPLPTTETEPGATSPPGERGQAAERLAGRRNLLLLVQLRWLAVAGQLATIAAAHYVLGVPLPLAEMLALLALLSLFNAVSWLRSRLALPVRNGELFAGLLVDVAVLTGQLFYAGGIGNPFIYLYLLQVAVGSVLLRPQFLWAMVGLTTVCFLGLTQSHRPLALPGAAGVSLPAEYIGGLLVCFVLNAALLVIFIGRINRNLRRRDAALADLRQRAVEEEHIVRMGLLASGAAHELGTPLATLSVILGDWSRMAPFAAEPELREEIEEMQRQLQRCKSIVSGILMSAGEARGEAPMRTTLHGFLDERVAHWRATRPVHELQYRRESLPNPAMVSDSALKQMIDNVLDNALEAAPQAPIVLDARSEDEQLVLRVRDRGPGFAPGMLERFGKPYQSSKGRPGSGLGLFLAVNVARSLGGRIEARNREGGGAEVTIRLPLAALSWAEGEGDGG
jgi:two-component system, sensor histidine kinase RegB